MRKAMPWSARLAVSVAAAGLFLTVPALAQSQQYPDITGKWSVEADGAILGNPRQWPRVADGESARLGHMQATLVVKGQQGDRFWGELITPTYTLRMVGSFTGEGQRFMMAMEHGVSTGTMVSGTKLHWCYAQARTQEVAAQVAGCSDAVRQ